MALSMNGVSSNDYYDIEYRITGNKYTCTSSLEADIYFIVPKTGYYSGATYGSQFTMGWTWNDGRTDTGNSGLGFDQRGSATFSTFYATQGERKFITSITISNLLHDPVTGVLGYKGQSSVPNIQLVANSSNHLMYYYADAGATRVSCDYRFTSYFVGNDKTKWLILPRETTISIPTSAYIADYLNIVIERVTTDFTHSIKYKFGTKTGYLLQNSTTSSYNWLIPIAFMDEIPSTQTSMTCTLTVETYYIDALMATKEYQITLKIDSSLTGPILEPTIVDTNNVTIGLTGNNTIIVKNYSIAKCDTNVTMLVSNDAITNSYIKNGDKTITGTSGHIYFPTSSEFEFYVETRRGLVAKKTIKPTFIDYVAPTCRQKITTTLSGEENTNATITLLITGNYFNGNFGAVNNTLKIEVQHTQSDGTMGDWVDVTPLIPTIEGNTYSLEITITGLRHDLAYNFTSRVTDKLTTTTSEEYVAKVLPVFDWSAEDFNFNVPINMNGQTVLRHNETANNLVVSSSGGFIYFRPKGTNDNSIEVKITPQGNIELKGDIIINGVSLKTKLGIT